MESAGVDWTPDILHPMFWGFQDLDVASGAPGPLRIYYPTYEGTPQNAPILKLCLIRYPVVLFMHGQPPCPDENYFKRWQILGMVLARSGYVVVMPKHERRSAGGIVQTSAVGLHRARFRAQWLGAQELGGLRRHGDDRRRPLVRSDACRTHPPSASDYRCILRPERRAGRR